MFLDKETNQIRSIQKIEQSDSPFPPFMVSVKPMDTNMSESPIVFDDLETRFQEKYFLNIWNCYQNLYYDIQMETKDDINRFKPLQCLSFVIIDSNSKPVYKDVIGKNGILLPNPKLELKIKECYYLLLYTYDPNELLKHKIIDNGIVIKDLLDFCYIKNTKKTNYLQEYKILSSYPGKSNLEIYSENNLNVYHRFLSIKFKQGGQII